VNHPRAVDRVLAFISEAFGDVGVDRRLLPDLRGVGEHLPAVAADVELALYCVVDPAGDRDVRADVCRVRVGRNHGRAPAGANIAASTSRLVVRPGEGV
jgi:hypothetical protein